MIDYHYNDIYFSRSQFIIGDNWYQTRSSQSGGSLPTLQKSFYLHHQGDDGAARTSEMLGDFYKIALRNNPEGSHFKSCVMRTNLT